VSQPFDRRTFLGRSARFGGALAALSLPGVLAACGSDDEAADSSATTAAGAATTAAGAATTGAAAAEKYGKVGVQLSWFKNIEFAGDYIAESEGYFTEQGFEGSELIAGGPDVDTLALILSDKALLTYTGSEIVAGAIRDNDAPLKIIGANFQKNPFCILSLQEKTPIKTGKDMIGKTIGVQAANEPVWQALLKILGTTEGDGPDQIKKVPAGFDPAPLLSGEVDGFFSFASNEPYVIAAKTKKDGAPLTPVILLLDTLGFKLYQQLYAVTEKAFNERKPEIVAAMKAISKGWQKAIADPELSKKLTLEVYGKELNLDPESLLGEHYEQCRFLEGGAELKTKGLFYMAAADLAENKKTLGLLGLDYDISKYYTNEILDEVYKDGIVLADGYTPGMSSAFPKGLTG
jgi:ABC-type nitrate/sulfonate/bicarbonate transport system substrate-binding protein